MKFPLMSCQITTPTPTIGCFFNFGFEGAGSSSSINARIFDFNTEPLQLATSIDNTECNEGGKCTHVVNIPNYGETYQFVFTTVGPGKDPMYTKWSFAHPVHLHGHSFSVAKIGYGTYDNTGRIMNASDKIQCDPGNNEICSNPQWSNNNQPDGIRSDLNRAPLKDTILVPAGGYAVVYFKANNPGYWFLHCHIEVHVEDGMAVAINEAKEQQMLNPPPDNIKNKGNDFTWEPSEFTTREQSTVSSGTNPTTQMGSQGTRPNRAGSNLMKTTIWHHLLYILCCYFLLLIVI